MTKQLLFLSAVIVSLVPIQILGNGAGFETPGSALAFAPERFPTAVLFNGSLAGAHPRAYQTGRVSGKPWRYTLSRPVIGSGESVVGSGVDVSGARGLSSIVKIDDGAISISVPEPGTMTTLGTGLATIAFLICKKRQAHSFLH